ncbi:MAG: tyrosine-type recombinase/integrase [Verrucomicrobiota bacterium]
MPKTPMHPTQDQVDRYLVHLQKDLRREPTTVSGYRDELEQLVHRGFALTTTDLTRFVDEKLNGTPLAPQTRNRRLAILRGFLRFLQSKKEFRGRPLAGMKRAKVPRHDPIATTYDELTQALETLARRQWSWRRARDGAILVLLFYSALRVSELQRLDVGQVDLATAVLRRVRRKGAKVEDVVLHPCAVEAVVLYLSVRPEGPAAALFLAKHSERTGIRSIQKMLSKLGAEAGLGNRLHPHALRHACATELASAGVATSLIQRHLAHESITTTERYIHVLTAPVRLAVAHLSSAPLEALKKPDDG